ncbi:MAG: glycosyltransferase family 2 protein [Oscillospiraceae bacterium]|jgi:cellulose synthase/poly-beta-1,6-N-acetylglucosamine synthase-like glycosyltransferase
MNHMAWLQLVTWLLVALTGICYLYQVVYLIIPFFVKPRPHQSARLHRYAILIAARNEEAVLPHLLDSIAAQDYPAELLTTFVVADNCTDRTAQVAQDRGARVFVRNNRTQVGKGYALHFLLDKLQQTEGLDRFDAFLVFDADNLLQPDYVTEINRTCSDGYEAFCGYRNTKNFGSSWVSAGYALWYLHDSVHLNQSRMLLGTSCAVSGTGFGFTRQLLERCGGWSFFTLTEDIEFNTWCATRGVRIGYCPSAMVFDEQPISFRQSWRQRTRWTQGGLQVSIRYAGDLLRGLARGGRTAYASFETATLSLWGYGMSALSCSLTLLTTFLASRWLGLASMLLASLVSVYLSLLAVALLTTVTQWRKIHATTRQKIGYSFTFPFFMMTFFPIAVTAVFRKFQWQPIAHTVAVGVESLSRDESHI